MTKTDYTACVTRPEQVVIADALDAGNYPERYAGAVSRILKDIKDAPLKGRVERTLGVFEAGDDKKLAQSNPHRLVVLQELLPKNKSFITRPGLDAAKQDKPNFMSGFYVDCGLNLVGSLNYETNPFLAVILADDLKNAGVDLKNARLIPYNILTSKVNENSPSGLVFRLSEEGKDTAQKLVLNTGDFKWDVLPRNESGLFRAYLYAGADWGAGRGLLGSYCVGRVVCETTGEASSREFKKLKQEAKELLIKQRKKREILVGELLA